MNGESVPRLRRCRACDSLHPAGEPCATCERRDRAEREAEGREREDDAEDDQVRAFRSRLLLPRRLPFASPKERRWWWNYRGAGREPAP